MRRRTVLMFMLAGLVGGVVAAPIAVYASHSFTDVPGSNTFHADIAWLADAGVTKGCNPPANTQYCPDDNVTRGQMAAFLKRLSEGQIVDAATAVNADNADKLDGLPSSAFMTKNVYDSDSDGVVDLLPRAAFNSTDDAPDGADFTLSTTITAPAPGILLLSGGIEAFSGANSDTYDCLLEVDGGEVRGTDRVSEVNTGGANSEEDCSTTGAIAIDAGTYTIDLEVIGVGATTNLTLASVWVLWVPLDGTGAIPTP